MIIAISGSVGSGKTILAKELGIKLDFEVIHLNEMTEKYKLEDVKKLQTFDFDLDKMLNEVEAKLQAKHNVIIESHFAHFFSPKIVDLLIVINRDLEDLKRVYEKRDYNEQKIKDNLEVESFNLCFYEALENGYEEEKQVFCIRNRSIDDMIVKIEKLIKKHL